MNKKPGGNKSKKYIEGETVEFIPDSPSLFPMETDVIGASNEFVKEFLSNIQHERKYRKMATSPDKTFFLDGPPGVGKTYAIKAINNQLNSHLTSLPEYMRKLAQRQPHNFNLMCFQYDIGKYGTAYINMGSRTIQAFFDEAKYCANRGVPTLVICDEADSLFGKRKNSRIHKEDHKIIETLMKNIQITHDTEHMYLILMSNLPESIDSAILRAGRIDKRYTFKLPDIEERQIAFEHAISQKNKKVNRGVIRVPHPDVLAELSDGFNYADIYQCVESALRERVKELIAESLPPENSCINQSNLERAVRTHKDQFRTDKYTIGFK